MPEQVPSRVTTLAAQLLAAGETAFRRSVTGEPRGPLCGMGICFECRRTVNGVEHVRTCQMISQATASASQAKACATSAAGEGTVAQASACEEELHDLVVVGAGPAGIAAACAAAESGSSVLVVDENPAPGGQIWRNSPMPEPWAQRSRRAGFRLLGETRVVAAPEPGVLLAESSDGAIHLRYRKLILAPGSRELFLPFPGWTLPNVTGAGGLQVLAKCGLPMAGKRVVVAGSGPLLPAAASYLRKRGATIVTVAEQTTRRALARFTAELARHPGKLAQAAGFAGLRYLTGCWPVAAEGNGKLEAVVLHRDGKTWRERCDYLACGFGLVANLELPLLLGCAGTDEWQETSLAGIYYAGSPGGVDLSLAEGEIAGFAAAGRPDEARRLFRARERAQRFRVALERAFALRPELRAFPAPDTIVCRCEDVTFGALRGHASSRAAKLETRCGMGACQGRVCGPACEFLLGWTPGSVRPPAFPARLETLRLSGCSQSDPGR